MSTSVRPRRAIPEPPTRGTAWYVLLAILLALGAAPTACEPDDEGVELTPSDEEAEPAPEFNAVTYNGIRGYTACEWGSPECNPPARSVEYQVQKLRDTAEFLKFNTGEVTDLSTENHISGVQRYSGMVNGEYVDHLVLTRQMNTGSGTPQLYIAEMDSNPVLDPGTRYRANSRRWGSCFDQDGRWATCLRSVNTDAPAEDTVVSTMLIEPNYQQGNGLQLIGKYAAVPLSQAGITRPRITFVDVSTIPPQKRFAVTIKADEVQYMRTLGAVAVAKLEDGTYLMIAAPAAEGAHYLFFYRSTGTTIGNANFQLRTKVDTNGLDWRLYRSMQLVVEQTTGRLYLLCMHQDGGNDWLDVFLLEYQEPAGGTPTVKLTKRFGKHLYCSWSYLVVKPHVCDFRGGTGVYVDPFGNLLVYATEHAGGDLGEFHSTRPSYNPPIRTPAHSWVELYEGKECTGAALRIDAIDSLPTDPADGDTRWVLPDRERMKGQTSSIRWALYDGVTVEWEGMGGPFTGYEITTITTAGSGVRYDVGETTLGNDRLQMITFQGLPFAEPAP